MNIRYAIGVGLTTLLIGCAAPAPDGHEICTVEAVAKKTTAGSLNADLLVPGEFLTGAEISNGGIAVLPKGCDFTLNALFSDETVRYIIEKAPKATLRMRGVDYRKVDASLSIREFSDGPGEARFFVTGVIEMRSILKARNGHEARFYNEPSNGS